MTTLRLLFGIYPSFLSALTAIFFSLPASANDSIGRVGVGGISFEKSEDIRMASEVLEISTKKIKVEYHFINDADHDIKSTIVFPMPAYEWDSCESPSCINHKPLRPFSTSVDGKPIPTRLVRRALQDGKDVTEQLGKMGLNDSQMFDTFAHCADDGTEKKFSFCGRTPAQTKALEQFGDWEAQETAYWEYTFPAKREVVVTHEYRPFVGDEYSNGWSKRDGFAYKSSQDAEVCFSEGTMQSIEKHVLALAQKAKNGVFVTKKEVEYILGTGRNWKGPIKEFKLRIIKEIPSEHISLCFPGKPVKISNTVLEFSQRDFIPQDKLIVFFYTVVQH